MYDELLLQERMAAKGLNFYRLAQRAHVDPKTAKKVVLTGTGNPDSIKKIVKALGLKLEQAVKRLKTA